MLVIVAADTHSDGTSNEGLWTTTGSRHMNFIFGHGDGHGHGDGERDEKGHGEFILAGGLGDLDGLLLRRKCGDGGSDVVAGGGVEPGRLEGISALDWTC